MDGRINGIPLNGVKLNACRGMVRPKKYAYIPTYDSNGVLIYDQDDKQILTRY